MGSASQKRGHNTILWQNNRELGGVVIRAMKQSIIQVGVF